MEMPTVIVRAHAITMASPIGMTRIHVALAAPRTMKAPGVVPYMRHRPDATHHATCAPYKHY